MSSKLTKAKLSGLVKAKRRENSMGLREAANDSKVSASTLSRLERGVSESVPDTVTLKNLSDWLGVSLGELLNENKSRLHVLTHPVWWQDEPMNPRDRIANQIKTSGENLLHWYDDILSRFNRQNIGLNNG